MECSVGPDIEDVYQSTSTSNDDSINKRVTGNTLNADSRKTFSEVMTKILPQVVGQYNGKKDRNVLH